MDESRSRPLLHAPRAINGGLAALKFDDLVEKAVAGRLMRHFILSFLLSFFFDHPPPRVFPGALSTVPLFSRLNIVMQMVPGTGALLSRPDLLVRDRGPLFS